MSDKEFEVQIEAYMTLKISEIWPDGNAPENPTVDDVVKCIKESRDVLSFIRDWDLEHNLDVCVSDNIDPGKTEHVEWR